MHKQIIIQPYDALVSVSIGTINSQIKMLKKKYDLVEESHVCAGLCNLQYSEKLKRNVFYMFINSNNTDQKDYWNTITHEMLHLTQKILEHRGVYMQKGKDNEPYAYVIGHIMGELYPFFEKGWIKIWEKHYKVK